MKDRINEFIVSENLTAAEFADKIGVQRSSVSHVLNGRNNPGFSFIQKILDTFPQLNSRWLLTGNGNMYESSDTTKPKPKSEPQLFQEPVPQPLISKKEHIQEVKLQPELSQRIEQTKKEDNAGFPIDNQPKKVTRVLIFYDDQTFEDFRPAK